MEDSHSSTPKLGSDMYDKKDNTAKPTVPNVDEGDILDI